MKSVLRRINVISLIRRLFKRRPKIDYIVPNSLELFVETDYGPVVNINSIDYHCSIVLRFNLILSISIVNIRRLINRANGKVTDERVIGNTLYFRDIVRN